MTGLASVPRYRTRGAFTAVANSCVYQNSGGTTAYATPIATGKVEWMADRVTPGWRKALRSGTIRPVINPMTSKVQTCDSGCTSLWYGTYPPSTWDRHVSGNWSYSPLQDSSPYVTAPSSLQDADVRNLLTEVSTRCLSQIGRSSANSWENLAEISKTVNLLKHPIASWFKLYNGVYKTMVSSGANAYLAFRYGVQPLVRDTRSILIALNRGVRPKWVTTRSQGEISANVVVPYSWTTGIHTFSYSTQTTERLSVRAMSIDEATANTTTDLGFEAKSLLTLWWELLPYSFVADWFVNIGDYLGALVASVRMGNLGSCLVTERRLQTYRYSTGHTVSGGWTLVSPVMGYIRKEYVVKDRIPGLSSPSLVLKSDFRLDDVTRIADSCALVAQQLAGLSTKFGRFMKSNDLKIVPLLKEVGRTSVNLP